MTEHSLYFYGGSISDNVMHGGYVLRAKDGYVTDQSVERYYNSNCMHPVSEAEAQYIMGGGKWAGVFPGQEDEGGRINTWPTGTDGIRLSTMAPRRCGLCSGAGKRTCTLCWGAGGKYVSETQYGNKKHNFKKCTRCNGSGQMKCDGCRGTGWK